MEPQAGEISSADLEAIQNAVAEWTVEKFDQACDRARVPEWHPEDCSSSSSFSSFLLLLPSPPPPPLLLPRTLLHLTFPSPAPSVFVGLARADAVLRTDCGRGPRPQHQQAPVPMGEVSLPSEVLGA